MSNRNVTNVLCLTLGAALVGCAAEPTDSSSEIETMAARILAGDVSDAELEAFAPTREEMIDLMRAVALASGAEAADVEAAIAAIPDAEDTHPAAAASCSGAVQRFDGVDDTLPYTWWTDGTCDNDLSDNDWVFAFGPPWSDVPEDYRWWASAWVRSVFSTVYPNNTLLGTSLCGTVRRLCIGTNGVTLAGGAGHVGANLYLTHL